MKKILLTSTVFLLVLSIYLGYRLIVPPCENCTSFKCDYSSTPWTGRIDAGLAAIMANNYRADTHKSFISIGNTITTDEDARSVWFPLEDLKSYIWAIENKNCSNDSCGKKSLGLRIYFAKYPDSSSSAWLAGLSGLPATYANRHTVFMIPTYSDGGDNVDFDPWSLNCKISINDTGNPNPPDTLKPKQETRYIFYAGASFTDSEGKNHGTLIPPGGQAVTEFSRTED